jgi:hypothetical protein
MRSLRSWVGFFVGLIALLAACSGDMPAGVDGAGLDAPADGPADGGPGSPCSADCECEDGVCQDGICQGGPCADGGACPGGQRQMQGSYCGLHGGLYGACSCVGRGTHCRGRCCYKADGTIAGADDTVCQTPPATCGGFMGLDCKCLGGTCMDGYCHHAVDNSIVGFGDPGCGLTPCTADCDCPLGGNCDQGFCGTLGIPPSGVCGADCPCNGGECRGNCCYLPDGTRAGAGSPACSSP